MGKKLAMKLEPVKDDAQREMLFTDLNWVAMEKKDGEGVMLEGVGTPRARILNHAMQPKPDTFCPRLLAHIRKPLAVNVPQYIIHGELLPDANNKMAGGTFYFWTDMGDGGWLDRYERASFVMRPWMRPDLVQIVPYWRTEEEKRYHRQRLYDEGAEGVVWAKLDAPYVMARSNKYLKDKFVETADVVVLGPVTINKRDANDVPYTGSATMGVIDDDGSIIPFGQVGLSTSANVDTLAVVLEREAQGLVTILQVNYLYATDVSLYQVNTPKVRLDKKGQTLNDAVTHRKHLRMSARYAAKAKSNGLLSLF